MGKNHFLKGLLAASLFAGQAFLANSQKLADISLNSGKKLTVEPAASQKLYTEISRQQAGGRYYFVVHFADVQKAKAAASGPLKIQSKIAANTYLVSSAIAPNQALFTQWGVDAGTVLSPDEKTAASLQAASTIPGYARVGTEDVKLLIEIPQSIAPSQALNLLKTAGFSSKANPTNAYGVYQLQCHVNEIPKLAALPFVSFVQPQPAPDHILNQASRSMSRANSLQAPLAQGGRNLSGSGITIGVGDDADPSLHPDLYDRIINHTPGLVNDHGAHTTGTVAGAGLILPQRAGFAPKARIVSQWFSGIWQNAATYVQDYDMVITNNSYGNIAGDCGMAGLYDLQSRMLDLQAAQYPQLLHVFASGNDGDYTCAPYPQRYATVLSGLQSAKNIITTGRTDYVQLASGSSSSGPVKDGRLKPEIVALGEAIMSAKGFFSIGNAYFGAWGTSMASPAVAGGLGLLYERYKQLHSNTNPNGSLMKALLLNGARDIGTAGPDFRNGFGLMHLENSLRMLETNQFTQNTIGHGGLQTINITVPAGVSQLKVMLYWHDPAASVLAAKTLVNDLDLKVIDPSNNTILPLVLNADAASVNQAATNGTDHVNNSEQVVINTPTPGTYTLNVSGFDVLVNAPQAYALVYDFVPQGISISTPFAGESWGSGGANIPVSWDYNGTATDTYTLEYSLDNGSSWTTISNNLANNLRFYDWTPPTAASTSQARMRITRNNGGESFTTGAFALQGVPNNSLAPATEQCEGYIKLNWTGVTGAEGYEVIMKQGAEMKTMATVSAATLTYTLGGLSSDSTYYVAARAIKGGMAGRWNTPVERRPNSGSCIGSISNGDLKIDSIVAPISGRALTSTALTASTDIKIRIKNLDDAATNNFDLKYSINGGAFTTTTINSSIAAGSTYVHTFSGLNFSATGNYEFVAVVKNNAAVDLVAANDTFRTTVRHLANPALTLVTPFADGFELASNQVIQKNTTGIAGTNAWDFATSDIYGRLRSAAFSGVAKTGTKAITLDVNKATPYATNPANSLVGTFNLSGYNNAQELRLDFWYKHHGPAQTAHTQNKVWVRGNDGNAWIEAYDLAANQPVLPGQYKLSTSLEIAKLLAANGQNFSSSTQVKFGQYGLYGAADNEHFAGYSFDDVRLYIASNDVQVLAIDTPFVYSCGLNSAVPIRIILKNSMNTALINVPVSYTINGGAQVNEIIANLPANTTVAYTFAGLANLSASGNYAIVAMASMPGDNVLENNQATATITNQPVITSFPYLQNFESGAGNWYAQGINNSWQMGTPASRTITKAASGNNAWKTTLIGSYNDNELSYLYSPCFNINSLANPTLSFSMAYDLEDCTPYNTICDAAWVEYSYNGIDWQKLGAAGSGTNWYDYGTAQVWTKSNQTHWHVATIPLPKQTGNISLRFIMSTDAGVTREGLAIDDIHIYENTLPIFTGPANSGALNQNVSGNSAIHFTEGGKILATLNASNNDLGNTEVKAYFNTGALRNDGHQYFANRNITVKPANPVTGLPVQVRFYFTDAEANEMRTATGCSTCTAPANYTQFNITKYTDANASMEDGSLSNNQTTGYQSIANGNIRFVPYDIGYYADFEVSNFSEIWLTDGNYNPPLPATWLHFDAIKKGNSEALLQWKTANEQQILHYTVQRAKAGTGSQPVFENLEIIAAQNTTAASYAFTDNTQGKNGSYLYRIQQTEANGSISFSAIKTLSFGNATTTISTWPNPVKNQLILTMVNDKPIDVQWSIADAAGRIVLNGKWQTASSTAKTNIDTQILKAGMYTLTVTDGTQRWYSKVVKAN